MKSSNPIQAKKELKELRSEIIDIYKAFMPSLYKKYRQLNRTQIALEVATTIQKHVQGKAVDALRRKSRRKAENKYRIICYRKQK
jgi:hypothetical protein